MREKSITRKNESITRLKYIVPKIKFKNIRNIHRYCIRELCEK